MNSKYVLRRFYLFIGVHSEGGRRILAVDEISDKYKKLLSHFLGYVILQGSQYHGSVIDVNTNGAR